jgi:F-type H+-transporting ATPase subunit b
MKFNVWTFIFQLINFFVLLYILKRLLFKPVRELLEKRRAAEKKAMEDSEKVRRDAVALAEEYKKKQAEFEAVRGGMLASAEEDAEERRKVILKKAEEESKSIVERGEAKLDREIKTAATALKDEVIGNSIAYASAILGGLADENLHGRLLGRLMELTPEMVAEAGRHSNSENGVPVEIVSARAVPEPLLEKIRKEFEAIPFKKITVSSRVDATLVAGAVLRVFDKVYDASLKGQISSFGQKLRAVE